jgi:hypothetical protein
MEEDEGLIRKSSVWLLSCAALGILFLLASCPESGFVRAEQTLSHPDIRVNRLIQIEDGGALLINDTVTLSSGIGRHVKFLDGFQIGFPLECHNSLTYIFAYDVSGRIETELDTAMNTTDFLWIDVSFPEPVDVSNGGSYEFTVVCVFSGLVKSVNQTAFRADFPTYPSLVVEAAFCNVTVFLPVGAVLESTSPFFLNKTIDSHIVLYNEERPLEAYANVSSWAGFTAQYFLLFEIEEWRREIKMDGWGGITATDFYQITNKGDGEIYGISFILPLNATDVSAQDVYGTLWSEMADYEKYVGVKVVLREALKKEETVKILITYGLPFGEYISQRGWQDYMLNVSLVRPDNWVVKRSVVIVTLPEGAEFYMSSKTPYHLQKEGFLTNIKFEEHNITKFDETNINLEYRYLILWTSFRPTIWVGTVAAVLGGILFIRKVSRTIAVVSMPLSSEILGRFVDVYEEKRRLKSNLESLEQKVRKGKISRRKYKLRKSSLGGHLSKLERNIAGLRREMEAAGTIYSERVKQLETAEAEIETLDKDIARVEVRFRRREISAEARRRLLDEYNRIKERAENTIAEILLRLQE